MSKSEVLTEELLKNIVRSRTFDDFSSLRASSDFTLSRYLTHMLDEKKLCKAEVIRSSGIDITHGYQMFSGERKASRDKVLAVAFAMGLTLKETRTLLACSNLGDLYCKNRRDAIIVFCISHDYDLVRTDMELWRRGETTICDGEGRGTDGDTR